MQMSTAGSITSASRQYSGKSYTLLVTGSLVAGYIASILFVSLGPYGWWVNYLLVGAIWGITVPVRSVIHDAFKYITAEFRDAAFYTWWDCVRGRLAGELVDFQRARLQYLGAVATVTGVHMFLWPVTAYLGSAFKSSRGHD